MTIKTVLVVADMQTDSARMERIVSEAGYEVAGPVTGADTLAAIRQKKPDLVLLDVVTDEMDGFTVCRKLNANPDTSGIPIVLISKSQQKVDGLWARQQGADRLVTKPYSANDLLEQIRGFE